MIKSKLALSVLALMAASHAATGQELPERIAAKKEIVIANVPNYPPLEFKDPKTGTLTGLDIDLGNAIGAKLGVAVKWEEISFEQLVSALNTGRADMIISGMTDMPGRRETLDFVDYLASGAQFYTTADRAEQYKTPADFCGKTVGASRRTSFPKEMEAWSKETCEKNGKPALKIVGTEGSADARTQLRQKRLDAAVQGSETLPYLLNLEPDTYTIVGEPFTTVHQGIAISKKDEQLRDLIAKALKDMIADGSYDAVLKKWELQSAGVKTVKINEEPVK
ncbi:ABC transporter substrate-binding protein [Brucella anthropi]|uniref:ABC transporter substrate-binding protein n=1 Tax=Brucella pecoris TaxID=867683 RepID=A0A5C5CYH9_9HYPH|nr:MULTISPECIES: ABC transporter substrate-binding protein [Brucella/Ochrobactrum group]KAB2756862.1 ABC transporter substrate-binding protein [Brucella anthropi]KAB2786743.1 ABC transporter substrate-binding protein [Brucella anthropi]MBB4091894.1 polar amino acid transport system substrate-binding protein [Brucella pecoris]MBM6397265.1 ABC transporter substrate-binding protein [Brucella anthropi]NIH75411.1 polar amino acid transport system substrate-binding protein [Ochrobactrum sp. P20RRXII